MARSVQLARTFPILTKEVLDWLDRYPGPAG